MDSTKEVLQQFIMGKENDPLWLKQLSFANILICSNLVGTMFAKTQKDLTSKQWLLLVLISSCTEAPTLSEIGVMMGCSRQNIKQIADVLKRKGYITFAKMQGDKNTIRLVPTQKWFAYEKECSEYTLDILEGIFDGFSTDELKEYLASFVKIIGNLENINNKL